MWYKKLLAQMKNPKKKKAEEPMCLEEKIIRADADAAIRKRMLLSGQYAPDTTEVNRLVSRVVKKIKEAHPDLSTLRQEVSGENLQPAVDAFVAELKIG
jgi:hypothetical protein